MYGIRWFNQYQYSFDRPGKEKMSKIFRSMEDEENSRNWEKGEHVLVEGLMEDFCTDEFPQPHNSTNVDDIALAKKLKYWIDKEVVHVRGEAVTEIPVTLLDETVDRGGYSTESDSNSVGDLDGLADPLERTTLSLSQCTQRMFANDDDHLLSSIELTQESQKTAMTQVLDSNLSNDQKGMCIFRDTIKKIDTHPDLVDRYFSDLHELNMKYTNIVTANVNSSKEECSEESNTKKRVSLITAATGRSTVNAEKRHKVCGR